MFRRDDRWREFWNGIDDHEEQAQPEPQLPTVAAILPLLQNRYSQQNIMDTLEYFHEIGDIRLLKVFGGPLNWSIQLTPYGKRKLVS